VKLFWMILSGVCILVAAVFLLRGDLNTAFVIATLGILAWFLNYRIQLKAIVDAADRERSDWEENKDGDPDEDSND
jgi:hypothetical protein